MFPMLRWSPTADRNALPNLLMALRQQRITVEMHGETTTYSGYVAYVGGDLLTLNVDTGCGTVQVSLRAITCITLG